MDFFQNFSHPNFHSVIKYTECNDKADDQTQYQYGLDQRENENKNSRYNVVHRFFFLCFFLLVFVLLYVFIAKSNRKFSYKLNIHTIQEKAAVTAKTTTTTIMQNETKEKWCAITMY